MQDAGIVILPAAGYRYGNLGDKVVSNAGIRGHYWSASSRDDENGYNLFFSSLDVRPDDFVFRYYANAVRLVTKLNLLTPITISGVLICLSRLSLYQNAGRAFMFFM